MSNDKENNQYIPGVCNIGPAEVRRRRRVGILAVIALGVVWGGMEWKDLSAGWRWWLFPFAAVAAIGWLQSAMGFCAAFGLSGVFKIGPDEEKAGNVSQDEFRQKDRNKAWLIIGLATLIGLFISGSAYWLAR